MIRTLLVLVAAYAVLGAARLPVSLWPQIAPVPPGTSGAAATAQPLVLAPGITVPAGGTGISPLPQAAATTASGQAAQVTGPVGSRVAPPVGSRQTPGVSLLPETGSRGSSSAALDDGPRRPSCTVTLSASRISVPAGGKVVDVKTQNLPLNCTPAVAVRAGWAQRLTADQPGFVRLSVTANTSTDDRVTSVQIADKVLLIQQAGLEAPAVSVVPGKLAFGLDKNKKPDTRRIAIQSDNPNAAVLVTSTAEWLSATPVKGKVREYAIEVDPARIPPGIRREAAVHISAGAAAVDVPVIVERVQLR